MPAATAPILRKLIFSGGCKKHRLPVLPVLTKCDKLKKNALIGQRQKNAEALGLEPPMLILFSAKTRQGRDEVWEAIDALVEEEIDA